MDKKLVSFRLTEDLMQQLRERATEDGISVTELVSRLLRQGLQTNENDRITALEDEIRDLRQMQQVNFSGVTAAVAPTPVYMFPQTLPAAGSDSEIKQRIANLENLMKEVLTHCTSSKTDPVVEKRNPQGWVSARKGSPE